MGNWVYEVDITITTQSQIKSYTTLHVFIYLILQPPHHYSKMIYNQYIRRFIVYMWHLGNCIRTHFVDERPEARKTKNKHGFSGIPHLIILGKWKITEKKSPIIHISNISYNVCIAAHIYTRDSSCYRYIYFVTF